MLRAVRKAACSGLAIETDGQMPVTDLTAASIVTAQPEETVIPTMFGHQARIVLGGDQPLAQMQQPERSRDHTE